MSILSTLIKSIAGGTPPAQALATAAGQTETWLGQIGNSIEQTLQHDPAVQAAVTHLVVDGKAALAVGAQWAGTALGGQLGNFAAEVETLIGKYAPLVAGASGGPLAAAGVAAIQALAQVGVAAVNSEVAAVVAANTPTAPAKAGG
ncbi:MAG TPA: hypothetical protein VJP88_09830 [Caulobacteraceae bacterium]|nr:hypothetical protein [Caulobacteraceae bacterium]